MEGTTQDKQERWFLERTGKMPEEEKREKLSKVIHQWNNNRLDLFEISQPDEVSDKATDLAYMSS